MKSNNGWIELFLLIFLIQVQSIRMVPTWYEANEGKRLLIDVEEGYNWYQAWNECARYDAQLVAIESEQKNHILVKLLRNINGKKKNLWIGGNVLYERISFNWAVNEQDFTFTNWDRDEVDRFGIKKQCLYIMTHKKNLPWNFVECDAQEFGFICEEMAISEETVRGNESIREHFAPNETMYNGNIYGLIG